MPMIQRTVLLLHKRAVQCSHGDRFLGMMTAMTQDLSPNTELLTPCALDVNRNFDLHVFSRAGPVAAATNLADKSAHPVLA